MPALLPPAADLLAASRAYLEQELLPTLSGRDRFQVRVTINMLALIQRELELGPGLAQAEAERLRALLGEGAGDLEAGNRELARRIRSGEQSADEALIEHLRRSTIDALRINNPKWLQD